ncbi:MAG: acyltransferase [Lachnospiraceae bacterium]|nr:acyltransferase [Lachnospiraceae bacterium]
METGKKKFVIDGEMSERFNIMKLLFMVMVVFLHSQALPVFSHPFEVPVWVQTVKDVIDRDLFFVAVPGFFILSSILLYSKEFTWVQNIKKKVRTILLPYVIINTFWLLFFFMMSKIPALSPYFSSDQYSVRTWQDVVNAYFGAFPLYYPFWFLKDLFLLNLIAPLFKWLVDKVPLLTGTAVLLWYFSEIPVPLLKANDSLFFWMVGLFLVKYGFDLASLDKTGAWEWTLSVAAGATVVFFHKTTVTLLVYILPAFFACYVFSGFLLKTRAREALLKWSGYAFFIFAFHEFYEAMIKKIVMEVLPQPGIVQLLEFLLLPLLIVMLCILAGQLFEKLLPKTYAVLMGGRVRKKT